MQTFSAGVLTVSDTCSAGTATDTSGPLLQELLSTNFTPTILKYELVPDDLKKIESTLIYFADVLKLDIIITSGGTGFGPRDVTPEATKNVIHREAPQFTLVMSLYSLKKTKFAALSRATCGIRNRSLIINMPGSKKAVAENFAAIVDIIPHALQHMQNDTVEIQRVHSALQANIKIDCCPEHSNGVPVTATNGTTLQKEASHHKSSLPARIEHKHVCPHKTARADDTSDRNSPYPMLPVTECLRVILACVAPSLPLPEWTSHLNLPPFRASIKDGYALKASGGKGKKRVVQSISAGDSIVSYNMTEDECFKINTGAAVPLHADCVIQVEDTKVVLATTNGVERVIEIMVEPTVDLDIRPVGCDLQQGELLFSNHLVYPGSVTYKSILASVGKISHLEEPQIGIISTGDELIEPGTELPPGKIYDSNMIMLTELLRQFGFSRIKTSIAKDNYESLKNVMASMVAECPITICTGGVSMGDKDFVKSVVTDLGFNISFGRCNMKPGKPMTFASNAAGRAVFGLPGNPVSSFVTFHLFVLPALRFISNYDIHKLELPVVSVELLNDTLQLDARPEYARATITSKNGRLFAEITGNQISSRLKSIDGADVLLHLPGATIDTPTISKGTILKASVLKHHFISKYE